MKLYGLEIDNVSNGELSDNLKKIDAKQCERIKKLKERLTSTVQKRLDSPKTPTVAIFSTIHNQGKLVH